MMTTYTHNNDNLNNDKQDKDNDDEKICFLINI